MIKIFLKNIISKHKNDSTRDYFTQYFNTCFLLPNKIFYVNKKNISEIIKKTKTTFVAFYFLNTH